MKKIIVSFLHLVILISFNTSCKSKVEKKNHLKLWYNQPANAQIPDNKNPWIDDHE